MNPTDPWVFQTKKIKGVHLNILGFESQLHQPLTRICTQRNISNPLSTILDIMITSYSGNFETLSRFYLTFLLEGTQNKVRKDIPTSYYYNHCGYIFHIECFTHYHYLPNLFQANITPQALYANISSHLI